MAARLVWRERLFPLARIEGLQNARSRSALALSGLHAVPRLQGQTPSAGGAALQSLDRKSEIANHSRRFLSVSRSRRLAFHRTSCLEASGQTFRSNRAGAQRSPFAARLSGRSRTRLPDAGPPDAHAVWWRDRAR